MVIVMLKAVLKYSLGFILPDDPEMLHNVEAVYLGVWDKTKWFYSAQYGFIMRQIGSRLFWAMGKGGGYRMRLDYWSIPDEPRNEAIALGLIKPDEWRYLPWCFRQHTKRRGPDTRRVRMWHTWGGNGSVLVRKDRAIILGDHAGYGDYYRGWECLTKREWRRKERHETKEQLRRMAV